MKNLIKLGKFFLIIFIALAVFDIAWLAYTFTLCSRAMDDTLSQIALVVAEENCLDATTSDETQSKLYSIKKLMVENAPLWLTYNNDGFDFENNSSNSRSASPTSIIQVDEDIAIQNLAVSTDSSDGFLALTLSKNVDINNDSTLYSYADCPQRGESITITLKANMLVRMFMFGNPRFDQVIPMQKQITVIGMKFYKDKDTESEESGE